MRWLPVRRFNGRERVFQPVFGGFGGIFWTFFGIRVTLHPRTHTYRYGIKLVRDSRFAPAHIGRTKTSSRKAPKQR